MQQYLLHYLAVKKKDNHHHLNPLFEDDNLQLLFKYPAY